MASLKRSRDTDMTVKLANDESLQVDSLYTRIFSTVAKGLPGDADTWDISRLLLNNEPFSLQCVSCWLNCGYSMLYGPSELDSTDIELLTTAQGLLELLSFCQAVGSPDGLLKAACSHLEQLTFVVDPPRPAKTVEVALTTGLFEVSWDSEVQQQVATQTAELLLIAHMLRLQPLLDALHGFVFRASLTATSLLYGALDQVFTEAVLDVALGSGCITKEVYLSSVLSQPASFSAGTAGHHGFFKLTGAVTFVRVRDTLKCRAQLLQDLAGYKAGELLEVEVDVFGSGAASNLTLHKAGKNPIRLPMQLLLGNCVTAGSNAEAIMHSPE
jgi:hypothetical protein